jgi:hypothetical protein
MTKLETIINKAATDAARKAVAEVLSLPLDDLVGIVGDPVKPTVEAYKPTKPSIFRLKKPVAKAAPKAQAERKPMVMSAARKAGLKLQGQYMGHLRGALPPVQAQAKKIKAKDGYKAALVFLAKAKAGKLPVKAQAKKPVPLHVLVKSKEYIQAKKVALKQNPPKKVPLKVKKG